ncbi:hypothetical protein LCGC14_2748830, partial [marine sediment metagenome]
MRRDQLNRRTHQTSAAAKAERPPSPRVIQRGRAVRSAGGGGGGPQIAYCKTDSPDDTAVPCYLVADVLAWSAATTYAADEWCEVAGTEYKSLQENNLNHAVSDPSWWEEGTISVPVHCLIINGSSLKYATPFLHDGDPILVEYVTIAGESVLTCTN